MHIALEDIRLIIDSDSCLWLEEERRKTRREVRVWGEEEGGGQSWSQLRRQKRTWASFIIFHNITNLIAVALTTGISNSLFYLYALTF
jgi:hypothetical protein